MKNSEFDLYQVVTEKIIREIEKGEIPWRKPWLSGGALPRNFVSKKAYRGINIWLLCLEGRLNPYFVTFKQCQDLGGKVKKGEKGTLVVFWKWIEKSEQKENGEVQLKKIPLLRYYHVFSAEQCEGLPKEAYPEEKQIDFSPIAACEKIIAGYRDCPEVKYEKPQAWYSPTLDCINLPRKESFESIPSFYAAAYHEFIHSTGHPKRLNRSGITDTAPFGSPLYSKEELIAELGASFLCGVAGIELYTLANSAAYLQGWLKALKADKKLLIHAAGQAQKAVSYVLGDAIDQSEPEVPAAEYKLAA